MNMYKNNNLLVCGFCGAPGAVRGRVFIWGQSVLSEFKPGDIILILSNHVDIPLSYISMAGGIISCHHTLYSHLVSAAMAFNIPCIVGAVFKVQLQEYWNILMDAMSKFISLNSEMDDSRYFADNDILNMIASTIINSDIKKPLAHLYSMDQLQDYKEFASGFFIDSNTILSLDERLFSDSIRNLYDLYRQAKIEVFYRFSRNPSFISKNFIAKEYVFVYEMFKAGLNLSLFFPNAENYNEILEFRKYVTREFSDFIPFKIGTMIESKAIINDLERILKDRIIDFAIIGMNDLLSSILGLERDDAKNNLSFSITDPEVEKALKMISNICKAYSIPFFISYPKFNTFLDDYARLKENGYEQFFGSLSIFELIKSYSE